MTFYDSNTNRQSRTVSAKTYLGLRKGQDFKQFRNSSVMCDFVIPRNTVPHKFQSELSKTLSLQEDYTNTKG